MRYQIARCQERLEVIQAQALHSAMSNQVFFIRQCVRLDNVMLLLTSLTMYVILFM